ncbi:MAG: glutamate 5-kinase [Candidatus Auribacterota bacterium]
MRQVITYSKRIVVKLGTGLLTNKKAQIDHEIIQKLVKQIAHLIHEGRQVVLVSSGAIGAGFPMLQLDKRPTTLPLLQASASIGQAKLMRLYDDLFSRENIVVGQILLTRDDLKIRKRHLNIRNTMTSLLQRQVLPIINENDTVSVDEIRFGDNDMLSALVANLIQADLLINLTNVDGLLQCSDDGKSLGTTVIPEVKGLPQHIFRHSTSEKSALGSGGMKSKLMAARMMTTSGEFMVIANGRVDNILIKVINGEHIGTLFTPAKPKMVSRKRWIAFFHQAKGKIFVDNGAAKALVYNGKSLLPKGIINIDGKFNIGDIVLIYDNNNEEIGRGMVNFSSTDLVLIMGRHTSDIEPILGHRSYEEIIHRDNLVITSSESEER